MVRSDGKTALITGGANGIGKATAELFVSKGIQVIIADIDQKLYDVADEIGAYPLLLDVSTEESWKEIVNTITKNFPELDIVVNNAATNGVGKNFTTQDPENMSLKTWHAMHQINLDSVFLGCKYGINLMKNNMGNSAIINVASRSGIVGVPTLAAYAASKAAIRNYTKSVALYCAQKSYNIRCNTVSPAAILTNMWSHVLKDEQDYKKFSSIIPLKRMGEAIEVANAILYLSSDDSQFITGTEIIIDGGILAGSASSPSSHKSDNIVYDEEVT